jgi:cytoskeletal protein RodZ
MKTGPHVAESGTPFAGSCATCGALLDRTHLDDAPDGLHCVFCGAPQDLIDDRQDRAAAPVGVGDALREARQARGESLEHAARVTHINERFLRALEDDEPSDAFPGAVYGRFFLREYAEHLALEPTPLVRGFDRAARESDVRLLPEARAPRDPARETTIAAVIAAIVLVGLLAFSWWTSTQGDAVGSSALPGSEAARGSAPAARTTEPMDAGSGSSQTTTGIVLVVHVVDRCWVQVTTDGRTRPGRTLEAGQARTFRARHTLVLTLGNAGGVRVRVNGRAVRTGPIAAVRTISFAWRHGHLILPARVVR